MSVSIVVGGQYGSEGKGKVACFWAKKIHAEAVVRVGGSNSGHTVYDKDNKKCIFRMLPTACILNDVTCVLPSGTYIDVPVLLQEVKECKIATNRLKIDPYAVIITDENKKNESDLNLEIKIGSTMSGTGAAVIERIKRNKDGSILMAKDIPELTPFLTDTKIYLRQLMEKKKNVLIEGTQGYGLSVMHSKEYPYVTSRDTTAAGFLMETGLSPFDVEHIIMVIRAFPIRVGGSSGPLENEINWKTVSIESGSEEYFEELTTVTHKVRRVARFSADLVRQAIRVNQPDVIVMNHIDYIDYYNRNNNYLSMKQLEYIKMIEKEIDRKINYCGNGVSTTIEMIERVEL